MDFGTVVIVVAVVAVVVAAASYWGTGRIYSGLGREGGLDMQREPPAPSSGPEVQEEIRQMLEAKSDRRVARGEPELDVDAELASLTRDSGSADAGLREEVRQLVVARTGRGRRRGKDPLGVEPEVARQGRGLGGDDPGRGVWGAPRHGRQPPHRAGRAPHPARDLPEPANRDPGDGRRLILHRWRDLQHG